MASSSSAAIQSLNKPDFSCSGDVHAQAINLWENTLRKYFEGQVNKDLKLLGDTYVLYNIQQYLQSFVEMTRRCNDRPQIAELVETLSPVFAELQPLPNYPNGRGWICRGGSVCNRFNRLINTEIQLCSAQFLGLIGALATDVVEKIPRNQQTNAEKIFVINAIETIANQLDRWLSPSYFAQVAVRTKMTMHDATDGQSKYFFSDKDLWFIDLLSDLSELKQSNTKQSTDGVQHMQSLQGKREQIALLIDFFIQRVSLSETANGLRAEIDRGFWRNYGDSAYALYEGRESPIACIIDPGSNSRHKTIRVERSSKYIDPTMGWDFSHARRLVPALDTLSRNAKNLAAVFDYHSKQLASNVLINAFSNQIIDKIWDQNSDQPLFSNFWDGKNGWYRAGYDNGTGCREGQAPYSLTVSFPTGGYPEWGHFNPKIRLLSTRLRQLTESEAPSARAFINKYYSSLSGPVDTTAPAVRNIWKLSFDSSLVGL